MKACTKCGARKPLEEFSRQARRTDGRHSWCKACCRADAKARRKANPEYVRETRAAWKRNNPDGVWAVNESKNRVSRHAALRAEFIAVYGGACVCCGETEPLFLTVEHKDGVPDHHRWANGKRKTGAALLYVMKKEGWPDDYTVLCFNCNCARGHFGVCPHEAARQED